MPVKLPPTLFYSLCLFYPLLLAAQPAQPTAATSPSLHQPAAFATDGLPNVLHYNRHDFHGDQQFWAMCQDRAGILYFGNNDGALIYDNENWHKVNLPNNSSVRSLLYASDGHIYAGGFNELGLIKPDETGKYVYESLVTLLRPEDRNIENIWQIHEVQGYLVFRTYSKLIVLKNGKMATIPAIGEFTHSAVAGGLLYLLDQQGVKSLDLQTLTFTPELAPADYNKEDLVAILEGPRLRELLVATKQGSTFLFDAEKKLAKPWTTLFPRGRNNLVLCGMKSSAGNYLFGTLGSHVVSLDPSGNLITANGTFNQLQDNTVHNLFETADGNVWALLNNGIDCVDLSSPVSVLMENTSVFDVLLHDDMLYAATNQGVYAASTATAPLKFEKVKGTEGQAWTLQTFRGQVLCSHDRGVFSISRRAAHRIEGLKGIWKVIEVSGSPGYYLACAYDGLYLLQYSEPRGFSVQHRIADFNESSRDILQSDEPGVFWICHGYKGVFRIKIDEKLQRLVSMEHYKDQNGLPSAFNTNVFRWKDEIVFTTNNGIFVYNDETAGFEPHPFLTGLFGQDKNVRQLRTHGDRTWFVHDDEAGYFRSGSPAPQLEKGLFLQLKGSFNRSMECIVPLGEERVLIGTNNGLYAFDLGYSSAGGPSSTIISALSYTADGVQHRAPLNMEKPLMLPLHASGIQFQFVAPGLPHGTEVQYKYILENFDDKWTDWQASPAKEYSYLGPGNYTFRVKARSLLGEEAVEASYRFVVPAVWYQTHWAYMVYGLLSAMLLYLGRKLVNRKISLEKHKTREEEMKKQKVLELELEQIRLGREKELIEKHKEQLEEDVIYKSKELANYTMLLVKKRELLTDLRDEMKEIKDSTSNERLKGQLRELTRKIGIHLMNEEHIKVFESNFEWVHHEFFNELKTHFPDLSAKELRLCALVRMNLTNKEIAPILNISTRGVETARYRLRKRLSLGQEENMVEFLEKLSPAVHVGALQLNG